MIWSTKKKSHIRNPEEFKSQSFVIWVCESYLGYTKTTWENVFKRKLFLSFCLWGSTKKKWVSDYRVLRFKTLLTWCEENSVRLTSKQYTFFTDLRDQKLKKIIYWFPGHDQKIRVMTKTESTGCALLWLKYFIFTKYCGTLRGHP